SAQTGRFVKVRPSGETNDPEPPLLKRSDDSRTWSSHCWVGAKPYLAWTFCLGKALYSHMPSSADDWEPASREKSKPASNRKRFIGSPELGRPRIRAGRAIQANSSLYAGEKRWRKE